MCETMGETGTGVDEVMYGFILISGRKVVRVGRMGFWIALAEVSARFWGEERGEGVD